METTRWLTNKLGEESWVPAQISNLLRADNIRSVVDSYEALSSGSWRTVCLKNFKKKRKGKSGKPEKKSEKRDK